MIHRDNPAPETQARFVGEWALEVDQDSVIHLTMTHSNSTKAYLSGKATVTQFALPSRQAKRLAAELAEVIESSNRRRTS